MIISVCDLVHSQKNIFALSVFVSEQSERLMDWMRATVGICKMTRSLAGHRLPGRFQVGVGEMAWALCAMQKYAASAGAGAARNRCVLQCVSVPEALGGANSEHIKGVFKRLASDRNRSWS
jgi:hypothetical protein